MIQRLFKRQLSSSLIGLDIGPDFIKLLQINTKGSPFTVEHYDIVPVGQGIISKEGIKDYAALSTIIKNSVRDLGIKTQEVALAIPRSSAIIKMITVDSRLNTDDIEARAWVEANRHFPDLVGDIYLDFSVLGPSPQDASQIELIIVACRKDQIDPYREVLKMAGLNTKIIDVNSYALERSLHLLIEGNSTFQTVALLNLDYNLSTFIVAHEKNLIYAHDQSFDGHRLMNPFFNFTSQGLTLKSQEENKDMTPEAKLIMLKEVLGSHLRHTLNIFYASRHNIKIESLYLSGDCAILPGLATFVSEEIGIETKTADIFSQMQMGAEVNVDHLKQNAPLLTLCGGLALSKMAN